MDFGNFYKNYIINETDLNNIVEICTSTANKVTEYLTQSYHNRILGKMETYKIIPFQTIITTSAVYELPELLSDKSVIDALGINEVSLVERISQWENGNISIKDKLKALLTYQKYIALTGDLYPLGADHYNVVNKAIDIVDMKLFNTSGDELMRDVDFILSENKLFLFGENAKINDFSKKLYALNINIDYDYVANMLGQNFNFPQYPDITKDEVSKKTQALCREALGGPSIKNLKDSLSVILNSALGVSVYDMYVRDPEKNVRWDNWNLSPFDFIVEAPEEFSSNQSQIDIMIRYIDAVKPVYTSYIMLLIGIYSDTYSMPRDSDNYSFDTAIEGQNDDKFLGRIMLEGTDGGVFLLEDGGSLALEPPAFDDYVTTVVINTATGERVTLDY